MSDKTVPWWRKAVQFVWKSIRVVARIDDRSKAARGTGARGEAASSEPAFEEPAVEKIDTDASLELHVEEETTLSEKFPEESPKSAPEVNPNPVHDSAAASSAEQAEVAPEAPVAETDETEPQEAAQEPAEVPESPADLLAEAALGVPAETDFDPRLAETVREEDVDEGVEEVPLSPADVLAEAVVEHKEPEAPVTGKIEEPAEAETGAGPEVVEAIAESAAEQEAPETSASAGEEQSSAPVVEAKPAVEADAPKLPPKAASAAPPQAAAAAPHQAVKREEGPDTSPVSVVVSQVYEGPFDLLLDLIRKQDIDIYDIPIAKITAQFLAYVNQLKASDVDVAGEFIYTASLLIHIKSKTLLPRAPSGPDDVQEDPRRELVERLLEHERFKNAAQMLQQKQMLEAATWTNPGMREFREDAKADAEIAADTTDLVRIFREILERARNRPVLNLEEDSVTVGQMIQFLTRRLTMEDKPVALRRLLNQTRSERALIAMFLALLELVRLQAILLRQDQQFSEIFIKKNSGFDAFVNQGAARDDWQ